MELLGITLNNLRSPATAMKNSITDAADTSWLETPLKRLSEMNETIAKSHFSKLVLQQF